VTLQDEGGLEFGDAQASIVWALDTLIADLRERNRAAAS